MSLRRTLARGQIKQLPLNLTLHDNNAVKNSCPKYIEHCPRMLLLALQEVVVIVNEQFAPNNEPREKTLDHGVARSDHLLR
ncbi:hypothetical protein JTE90_008214 [Oedothorax gibbosus]|uniref:Uncharacterized protein n=1 Tax=Oedothorax gibbosus TaxID=931172 RepID=A0AAV6TUL8_9ARAC|nr:hypothetical protein JTE90_008214 [Oedothorax gibbosus]